MKLSMDGVAQVVLTAVGRLPAGGGRGGWAARRRGRVGRAVRLVWRGGGRRLRRVLGGTRRRFLCGRGWRGVRRGARVGGACGRPVTVGRRRTGCRGWPAASTAWRSCGRWPPPRSACRGGRGPAGRRPVVGRAPSTRPTPPRPA